MSRSVSMYCHYCRGWQDVPNEPTSVLFTPGVTTVQRTPWGFMPRCHLCNEYLVDDPGQTVAARLTDWLQRVRALPTIALRRAPRPETAVALASGWHLLGRGFMRQSVHEDYVRTQWEPADAAARQVWDAYFAERKGTRP
jgi:hypothetical protein